MPGAYGIQVDNENVIFKTKSGKTDVRAYYNRELKKLGYSQVGYSEGGKGFLDFYEKGEDMVSITIADDFSDSSTTLVIIG